MLCSCLVAAEAIIRMMSLCSTASHSELPASLLGIITNPMQDIQVINIIF